MDAIPDAVVPSSFDRVAPKEQPRERAIMSDIELEIDWQMPCRYRVKTYPLAERIA
jgi:hypothetical protein